jgi:hypothetical protein
MHGIDTALARGWFSPHQTITTASLISARLRFHSALGWHAVLAPIEHHGGVYQASQGQRARYRHSPARKNAPDSQNR